MDIEKVTRPDRACECIEPSESLPDGIKHSEERLGDVKITRVEISSEREAKRLGKSCGEYVTFGFGRLSEIDDAKANKISAMLAKELKKMAEKICHRRIDQNFAVLAAGLGNAKMTPDAVGPEAISRTTVTGHIYLAGIERSYAQHHQQQNQNFFHSKLPFLIYRSLI